MGISNEEAAKQIADNFTNKEIFALMLVKLNEIGRHLVKRSENET